MSHVRVKYMELPFLTRKHISYYSDHNFVNMLYIYNLKREVLNTKKNELVKFRFTDKAPTASVISDIRK